MRSPHTNCNKKPGITRQLGQSMVEYTVILAFGIMVLISGDDIFFQIRDILRDNYQGYSYSISLSDQPTYDNLGEYLIDEGVVEPLDPNKVIDQIKSYTEFPELEGFPDGMPNSASDILDGATSFF